MRAKYEQARAGRQARRVKIHVIGFAKLVGDLIDGLVQVMAFFAVAAAHRRADPLRLHALRAQHRAGGGVLAGRRGLAARPGARCSATSSTRSRCWCRSWCSPSACRHGAQKMNGIMQDIGRGTHRLVAARYTFRRLFLAGLTALLADAVGFAVLMVIDIPVIRELALTASIGVARADLHQPAAAAGAAVATSASARRRPRRSLREEHEAGGGRGVGASGLCSTASPSARWAAAPSRCRAGARGWRLRREPAAADRRPRPRRAGAARRLALQPRQRLHHRATTRCPATCSR